MRNKFKINTHFVERNDLNNRRKMSFINMFINCFNNYSYKNRESNEQNNQSQ